jgi:hypothetical protein
MKMSGGFMSHRFLAIFATTVLFTAIGFGQMHANPTLTVEGDVRDASGSAISGATVISPGTEHTTTDGNGHFVLKGIHPGGTFVVSVTKPQYTFQPDRITLHAPAQGAAVNLKFTGTKSAPAKK